MANIVSLSNRVRAELGDIARSFTESFAGNGQDRRFQLTVAPVNAQSLSVTIDGTEVSNDCTVEEVTGLVVLPYIPTTSNTVVISGLSYKYFTDVEINHYIWDAFEQHSKFMTTVNGVKPTIQNIGHINEYPIALLASIQALYTLATDASFDIDISSPDGVTIPRSQRYRQLMEIIYQRREQYKELCQLLDIGMHAVTVFDLRRVAPRTNRYVPIYIPQEVDDGSLPQRVYLEMPNYGDATPSGPVQDLDLSLYSGDDYEHSWTFAADISTFTPFAQIRMFTDFPDNTIGPLILATPTFSKSASGANGGITDTLTMYLTGADTADLPHTSYWDLQFKDSSGKTKTYFEGKVFTKYQVSIPYGDPQ